MADTSPRRRIEVSAGVIERDGKILIAQRRPGDHLALCWEFPGGKREPGESWEECLRREILEELGVHVAVGSWIDAVTHAYEDRDVHLRFFRCGLERGTPASLHCHDLRWVEPAALLEFVFPPADAPLVRWLAATASARPGRARVVFARRGARAGLEGEAGGAHGAREVDVPRGTRLDEAAARCGARRRNGCGVGQCGACVMEIVAGADAVTPRTAEERAYFALEPAHERRRLACQACVTGDVTVVLAESQLLHFSLADTPPRSASAASFTRSSGRRRRRASDP